MAALSQFSPFHALPSAQILTDLNFDIVDDSPTGVGHAGVADPEG